MVLNIERRVLTYIERRTRTYVERLALIYIRVSSKKQADNFSFEYQEKDCTQYAQKEGTRPVGCYKDIGSGLSIKLRPNLMAMFEFALDPENGITDIIFWELDRFSRNIKDFFVITEELINAGNHPAPVIRRGKVRSPLGRTDWHQKIMSAQGESRKISKRTKAGQRTATENGRHIGAVPWGYITCYDPERVDECGWLTPDPELWPHVLRLWRMAKDRCLPMKIANEFEMQGVPSPSGEPWSARAVRYILKNIKYAGWGFRGKEPESRLPGPKDDTPMTICENAHQAAVDYKDWLEIQEQIEGRQPGNAPPRSHGSESLLSSVAKCGECKTEKKTYGLTKSGTRLRCSHKKNSGKPACPNSKDINMELLEKVVIDRARNIFLTEETLEGALQIAESSSYAYVAEQDSRKSGLKAKKRTVENQISNLTNTAMEGAKAGKSRSIVKSLIDLEKEQEDLEEAISQIEDDTEELRLYVSDKETLTAALLDLKTYTEPKDPEAAKELVKGCIERVEVFSDRIEIYYRMWQHGGRPDDWPNMEIIYLKDMKDYVPSESCLLGSSTGPVPRLAPLIPGPTPSSTGSASSPTALLPPCTGTGPKSSSRAGTAPCPPAPAPAG